MSGSRRRGCDPEPPPVVALIPLAGPEVVPPALSDYAELCAWARGQDGAGGRGAAALSAGKLKTPRVLERLEQTAATAREEGWPYERFLEVLLEAEVFARDASGIAGARQSSTT